ncbi:MAG: hypothetical protein ABJB03_01840 [Rhodoglobus sp.]
MDWTDEDPGLGDTGQLDHARDQFTTWIGQLEAIRTNSFANRNAITSDVWSGSSTDAWITRFLRAVAPVTTLIDAFGHARDAIEAYRVEVISIRRNADGWRDQASEARRVLHMSYAGNADPSPEEEQRILDEQRKRKRAQHELDEALRMLHAYAGQRAAADSGLVAAFSAALPPDWPAQQAALAAVGIDTIGEIANVGNLKDAMVDAANSVIDMDGEYEESAAALSALLTLYGNDEAVTSAFYQELGGEKTVELVDRVGWYGDGNYLAAGAALALAAAIRTGLSTGSTGWTQNQSESFAEGMMAHAGANGGNIGYLFNDPDSPLGETLAVAMADAVDQWMRVDGNVFDIPEEPNGGTWLNTQEHEGQLGLRVIDPSGPIFSTLGHYPDAAYEWLTSSDGAAVPPDHYGNGAADSRISYWFDTRFDVNDQGYQANNADQLQGISELFYGALQASGGPTDINGLQLTDVATLEGSATLTHDIILTLLGNQHFTQDGINAFTSAALAGAFSINIPAFAEYPITHNFQGELDALGDFQHKPGPGGGDLVIPVLSDRQLAAFLGVAGSHESGMGLISDNIRDYQQTLLNASISNPVALPLSEAIDHITSLEAALTGASLGEKIETGEDQDKAIREVVGAISTVVGAVPIPGLGEAVGGAAGFVLDWAQDASIEAVTGHVTDGVENIFTTNAQYQSDLADAGAVDRDNHRRMVIASMVYTYLTAKDKDPGFSLLEDESSFDDSTAYFKAVNHWLVDNQSKVDAALSTNQISSQNLDGMSSDYTDTDTAYRWRP